MRQAMLMPVLLALGCTGSGPAAAQAVIDVPPFRSVQLSDGGHVTIRHGAEQRVTLVEGEADIAVEGTRLRIGRCTRCTNRSRPQVDIVVPALDAVSVDNGGRLVLDGAFPRQARLAAAVSNGGMLDARSLAADQVSASVAQGGLIYTHPLQRLEAAVNHGGAITYWGEPRVQRAVDHGGVVQRGDEEDAARPLDELMPQPPQPPRLPTLPKVQQ